MKFRTEVYEDVKLFMDNGNYDRAIRALEKLLESYPDFGQAHYDLASLYLEMDEKEKALEHYRESINLEPDNAVFCKGLADLYYVKLGNVDEALKLYRKALETDPNDCETLMILGNLAVVANKFDQAKGFYQRVLEMEPWNDEAATFVEKLDRRRHQGPGSQTAEARYQKSQALFQSGNIEGAIKELEKLLAVQPESALAHNDLGVLYYQSGCKDKSLIHYQEAVRLDPDNSVYQKNLADFYFVVLDRVEDALEIYLKVLTEDPTDIETLMASGHICKTLGSPDKAQVFFKRVLDIEPWNLEAKENLNQVTNGATTGNQQRVF